MLHTRRITAIVPRTVIFLAAFLFFPGLAHAAYGDVTTFLGHTYAGDDGPRTEAVLDFPEDVEILPDGTMYVADTFDNVIRRVSTNGAITRYGGTGDYGSIDGYRTRATFALPKAVVADTSGNVYVADSGSGRIRKIARSGSVTTLATGLRSPQGLAVRGTTLYIADTDGNAIYRVSTNGGTRVLLTNRVRAPKKMTFTADGLGLYVANSGAYSVVRINVSTGGLSVIAGTGVYGITSASLICRHSTSAYSPLIPACGK